MPHRRCGRSGLYLSALALSLDATPVRGQSQAALRAALHQALEWNINHIDLASGDSVVRHATEHLLGSLFERDFKRHRDDLIITSNAGERAWPGPYGAGGGRKHILSRLDQTLGRLGLDHVDVLCAGPFDHDTPLDETIAAVGDAIAAGKARYAGVSSYTTLQTCEAIKLLESLGLPLTLHHAHSVVFGTHAELALTDVLESNDVGAIRHFPRPIDVRPRSYREVLLTGLARDRGQTPIQVAIAWSLQQPSLASVSLPAANPQHLIEFVTALQQLSFTAGEKALLGDLL
jgi:L-glyceraldehyde 3-phosphate reductase